ncbi:MAG: tetratricopeptide repeat protein [Alphaproteobacteria bacterium]|nr:tetratricopeptide repeat protein [Alphaproteobacteria bacterium]
MSDIDASLDTAFQAYNNHQFDMAEDLVRDVLTISPTNGDALYLLGLIAYRANAYEPAEKLLYEAVKFYPQQENYALALASVLQKTGRLDEALSYYSKYPNNATGMAQTGYIYLQKGQTDFAGSAFKKALELDKNCLTALIGEALIDRQNDNHVHALEKLIQAQSIGVNAELNYQLSVQYRLNGHFALALDYINLALADETTASFLNEKGLVFEALADDKSAQKAYEEAIELNAYAPDSFYNLGNIYLRQENYRQAEDYYKKALALDADFLNAHHNLAIALCKQNRKPEGLEHYREALIIQPTHIPTLYNLAMMLEEMGDYSESAGLYFNVLALKAKPDMIEFRIANTLAALSETGKKEAKEAIDFAKGWVKHFPESLVAQHTLNALTHTVKDTSKIMEYAKQLYDLFAKTYDLTMEKLEAQGLLTVLSYINQLPDNSLGDVLDLACGTGMLSVGLNKKFISLTGVDISGEMLKYAKQKEKYTSLIEQDVLTYLETTDKYYDLICAVELSGYVADIERLIKQVKNHLKPTGRFVLTIENTETDKVYLSEQGRYLYRPDYIQNILKQNGFQAFDKQEIQLRKEGTGNQTVIGTVFYAVV